MTKLSAIHTLSIARETAYAALPEIDGIAWARGFVPCDDGGQIFVSVEIVNLTEIVTVGPIFYDNEIVREAYVMDDTAEAVETLTAAMNFRRYDFSF